MKNNINYHTIVTHKRPHLDEIIAILLLMMFGEKIFPGISKAKFVFWDAGNKTPDGRPWQKWQDEGFVMVGVGGGRFDEHPTEHSNRKEEECAATLVANGLKIRNEPWLEKILRYTTNVDTKGGTNGLLSIENLIRLGNKKWFEADPNGFMDWALQSVRLCLNDQISFFTEVKKEFDENSDVFQWHHNSNKITIVAIDSDSTEVAAYARSKFGVSADVVIQTGSKGHIFISTQKSSRVNLDEVISLIRNKEMQLNNIKFKLDKLALTKEGHAPGSEVWYYHKPAASILNGGPSAPGTVPTKIDFLTIVNLVKAGLNERLFHSHHYMRCRNGNCAGIKCPWFNAQLERCSSQAA
jgi:hypothetical protein